jgi:SnoaL-like domain
MDVTMEKKLREMIDRDEIWQVLLRYGRGLDRFDRELVRSCYFDDAIDDHDTFVGGVEDFIDWANETSGYFVSHHHGVMNHSCELDGDDAYCETYFLFTGVAATPPHALAMGRYIDHFQRRNSEWRIANRVCVIEGTFELADSRAAAEFPSAFGPHERQPATRDRNDVSYHRPPCPRQPRST